MQALLPLTIRYSAIPDASAQELDLAAGPLLQAGLEQSHADGICFYRLDRNDALLELVSLRGLPASSIQPFHVQPGERTRDWLLSLSQATHVETSAWRDWRLERLPEFVQNRFETAVAIPLATEGTLAGILTAVRLARDGFALQELSSLLSLQASLESLLAVAASREENARLKSELQRLTDRLAGRKHIERAKGIIQTRHGWTEEEAYLHLRRLSRKTRKPMGEIARSVIVHSTSGLSPKAP
jgi:transcriptional regulator with GAF, ATPase, and Fis domain